MAVAIQAEGDPCETLTALSDEDHKSHVENRTDKQAAGTCVRKCCLARAEDGSDYCKRHGRLQLAYHRLYMKRKRAEWDAAGWCTRCGSETRKRGSKWCLDCLIRLDRLPKQDHKSDVENQSRSQRIAARLIPWTNSPKNEGRVRLRGGKRGAPTMEDRDRRDLADIQRILVRYEQAIGEAYSSEVKELSREQQAAARRAAHAGLALAVRLGMEALVRYGYEVPVLHPDEIGEDDEETDS